MNLLQKAGRISPAIFLKEFIAKDQDVTMSQTKQYRPR